MMTELHLLRDMKYAVAQSVQASIFYGADEYLEELRGVNIRGLHGSCQSLRTIVALLFAQIEPGGHDRS